MKKSDYIMMVLFVTSLYTMCLIGQSVALHRGYFAGGGEGLLPIAIAIVFVILQKAFNEANKLDASAVPLPSKRFTTIDTDSETVHVNEKEVPNIILYVAEVEEWLDKEGLT